jgi:pSer/pThr/pTyr-binding forkhead associated (FHA) protein
LAKKISLKIIEGNNIDTIFELENDKRYEVRRVPPTGIPDNIDRKLAVFLADPEVSKLHASLTVMSGELIAQDLGSTNGIYVNGKRASKALISNNDKLRIGTTVFLAICVEENLSEARTFIGRAPSQYSKSTHDFKKLAKVLDDKIVFQPDMRIQPPYNVGDKAFDIFVKILDTTAKLDNDERAMQGLVDGYFFSVRVLTGPNEADVFDFYKKQIVVGRTKDLWLKDKSISREHAIVEIAGKGIFKIRDLGSQNGTFINDQKVQIASFREDDVVRLGDTALSFSYKTEDF